MITSGEYLGYTWESTHHTGAVTITAPTPIKATREMAIEGVYPTNAGYTRATRKFRTYTRGWKDEPQLYKEAAERAIRLLIEQEMKT